MRILLFLFFFSQLCEAQSYKLTKVIYEIVQTPRLISMKTTAALYVGEHWSLYVSNVGSYPGEIISENGGQDVLSLDKYGNQIFKDYKTKTISMREIVMSDIFISEEALPVIEWELHDESKVIEGYQCFMATSLFRGRNYEIWYAPEIPISDGPWKFYNLPGLIIEAKDDSGRYSFKATEIISSYESDKKENTKFSIKKGKVVKLSEFRNAYATMSEHWINASIAESETVDDFKIEAVDYYPLELIYEK